MATKEQLLLENYKKALAEGKITSLEPILPIFSIEGHNLNLLGRDPMIPAFKLNRPKRTTLMTGRQVSKSFTLAENLSIMSGFCKDFHTAIVEPRFSQKKNFNRQILTPLLRDCSIRDLLIDKTQIALLDAKVFKSGSIITLINGLLSADSARGISGASCLCVDETSRCNTRIITYDLRAKAYKIKKISEILANDVLLSYHNDNILYSVAVRDASYHGFKPCYRITTKSGRYIECTEGHLLPTNKGKLRLSEIVEYANSYCGYASEERDGRRLLRTAIERNYGFPAWGCIDKTERGCDQRTQMESRMETAQVQFVQVPAVTRARNKRTVQEGESRLRGLLVSIDPKILQNISLVVSADARFNKSYQEDNAGVSFDDNASNSTGLGVCGRRLSNKVDGKFFYDPIVSIEYIGDDDTYDIEVVGTHNFILANGICSYNCQDILASALPVFEAITDAKTEAGFRIYSGTAKTSDGTLAMKFEESSQGHWCIKCECGKYNIASLDEQLLQMIGKEGCSCAYCGRLLDVTSGYYVHKYPTRIYTHVGYHMPQIIFGFHNTERAWTELLYKKDHISRTAFLNEVLGAPDDLSVKLLSLPDLLAARNNIHSKEEALEVASAYPVKVLGVDWGGGGGGDSATGLAVIAKNEYSNHFECLYLARLQQGMTPEQEADVVARIANEFEVDCIAHDYTGAGFVRESLFTNKYPQWLGRMYPISYSYKPTNDMVIFHQSGSRGSYIVDKTKSLLMTINAIKYHALLLPWFDPKDGSAPHLDFLAIIEHPQDTMEDGVEVRNTVQRSSTVYLLDKVAGRKDDAAQAVNIGFVAMCNMLKQYPIFTFDSKYEMSEEQYRNLFGPDN